MLLNLHKLDKMSYLALENALRLHNDSILLFKNKKYASALALSIISQEEIGKMHMINDFVWHSRIEGRMPEYEKDWLELLYKHPRKQYSFQSNTPLNNHKTKSYKIMNEISLGRLEAKKHEALYVGLQRPKGKIQMNGKIKHPFDIKEKIVKDQITKINDYLLIMGLGIINEFYCLDGTPVETLFTRKLIRSLSKKWAYKSKEAQKHINSIEKSFKEKII